MNPGHVYLVFQLSLFILYSHWKTKPYLSHLNNAHPKRPRHFVQSVTGGSSPSTNTSCTCHSPNQLPSLQSWSYRPYKGKKPTTFPRSSPSDGEDKLSVAAYTLLPQPIPVRALTRTVRLHTKVTSAVWVSEAPGSSHQKHLGLQPYFPSTQASTLATPDSSGLYEAELLWGSALTSHPALNQPQLVSRWGRRWDRANRQDTGGWNVPKCRTAEHRSL